MAKYQWKAGVTDRTILVFLQDSSSAVGAGLAGVVAADLTGRYIRVETDNDVTIATLTLSDLSALTDAHSDGGWLPVDGTNAPGWYRLDLPDAILASGAWTAGISLKDAGANDIAQWTAEIEIVAYDSLDAVRLGLTALPNAAPDAAGGLPISDAGGLDLDAQVGTKITAIDGKVANLPSDPADQSIVIAATDAIIAAIAALNNLSSAQAQTAAAAALTAYDPPTKAELDSGLASADDAVLAAIAALDTLIDSVIAKTDLIPGTQDGKTYAQTIILMASVLLGKASGLATTTAVYRNMSDSKTRVTATVDADGNRSAVTLDAT